MVNDDKENAERFKWLLENCQYEEIRYGRRTYQLRLDMFYNGNAISTIDYLMGKIESHPIVEQYLKDNNLFGR